MIRTEIPVSWS